jgi:hypothetical protein
MHLAQARGCSSVVERTVNNRQVTVHGSFVKLGRPVWFSNYCGALVRFQSSPVQLVDFCCVERILALKKGVNYLQEVGREKGGK